MIHPTEPVGPLRRISGVRGLAFLDDFLFMARRPEDLCSVSGFLSETGFCINEKKSVLRPTSVLVHLGLELNLSQCLVQLKPKGRL